MSHDFAKKDNKKRSKKASSKNSRKVPEKKRLPSWFLFGSGIACTLFVQFIIHLAKIDTSEISNNISEAAQEKMGLQTEKANSPKKPVYRFYDELKTQEVTVDAKEVEQREQADYNYALQAGSFKAADDAEQQRAEIILLGLDATVESKTSANGSTRYRVIVGPFTSRSKLQSSRSTLINNNVPTLVIKRG